MEADTSASQNDEVVMLEKQIAYLEKQLDATRTVNSADDDARLTYADLGISSEDIFRMIESYTLTSAVIHLTKEKLAKVIHHHTVRHMGERFRDGRTFNEVLELRICKLSDEISKLRESSCGNPDVVTELEIVRLTVSMRDLIYIREIINPPEKSNDQ